MAAAPYNTWYDATYDAIFTMADWSKLNADVPKKVACVYAWMPLTIMGVKHAGGMPKWATYSLPDVQVVLNQAADPFAALTQLDLIQTDIATIEAGLLNVLELVFPLFGSVAASKYLHFSAPRLIPMWDRSIRIAQRHGDSPQGFLSYVRQFKNELSVPENLLAAQRLYSDNSIRGWDIFNMRSRDA
jgi:hypothetical protein